MLFSKTPVINMHPKMAKIMQINFLCVIFSLKSTWANANTKIGASDNKTAAKDNGMLFMDVL